MSIWPALIASRTTEVAPSWIFSVTGTPFACSTCEMMLPSSPPSVSILDDTTTPWALATVAVRATANAAAAILVNRRMMVSLGVPALAGRLDIGRVRVASQPSNQRESGLFRAGNGLPDLVVRQAAFRRVEIGVLGPL